MDNDIFTYVDMMSNGPAITFMSILTEIICFVLICGISISVLFLAYKLKPVLSEYKKHFIFSGIGLILLFNLIYSRLPVITYVVFLPFLTYLIQLIFIAVLSVVEYLILSSKKTSKTQLIKALALQGVLILVIYNLVNWIAYLISCSIISSII